MAVRASVRSLARSLAQNEPRLGARAERTRAAILQAAEDVFAERGFAATRLQDVAARVGIRRASIVYYFKDKRELYDAVLAGVFAGVLPRLRAALEEDQPLPDRIELSVRMFVDYVVERPALPRLLLREVADDSEEIWPLVRRHTRPFIEFVGGIVRDRRARNEAHLTTVDPAHVASAVAGATIFFAAAAPALLAAPGPLRARAVEAHREQVLEITRRLLNLRPESTPASARAATRLRKGRK